MNHLVKVLIASDGSEPVLHACEMLIPLLPENSRVRVLTVLSYELYPRPLISGAHFADEASRDERAREASENATRDPRLLFEKAGIQVETKTRYGNPPDEILAEVDEWEPALLVMGRRRVRGLERILGSVSEHVVRRVGVPTVLVP